MPGKNSQVHFHEESIRKTTPPRKNTTTKSRTPEQALHWRDILLSKAKLKASSQTSGLLSGFAMVALVELQLEDSCEMVAAGLVEAKYCIPQAVLVTYAVSTTLLVSVHLLALMMSTCILPHVEASSSVEAAGIGESPHVKLKWYIELAWCFSTVIGLLLFLFEIGIVVWMKFYHKSLVSAIAVTVVLVPMFILFGVFSFSFYRRLLSHQTEKCEDDLNNWDTLLDSIGGDPDAVQSDDDRPNSASLISDAMKTAAQYIPYQSADVVTEETDEDGYMSTN